MELQLRWQAKPGLDAVEPESHSKSGTSFHALNLTWHGGAMQPYDGPGYDAAPGRCHPRHRASGPAPAGAVPAGDELSDRPRLDPSPGGMDDDVSPRDGRSRGGLRIDGHRRTMDRQADDLRVPR